MKLDVLNPYLASMQIMTEIPADPQHAFIPLSGGLDSTLVLLWAIKKGYRRITTFSCRGVPLNGPAKVTDAIIQHIFAELQRLDLVVMIEQSHVTIDQNYSANENGLRPFIVDDARRRRTFNLPDAQLRVMTMAPLHCPQDADFLAGFSGGDNYWMFKDELEPLARLILKHKNGGNTQIHYPLAYFNRTEVMRLLHAIDPKLFSLCRYCCKMEIQNDNYINCGCCDKCLDTYHRTFDPVITKVESLNLQKALLQNFDLAAYRDNFGRMRRQHDIT